MPDALEQNLVAAVAHAVAGPTPIVADLAHVHRRADYVLEAARALCRWYHRDKSGCQCGGDQRRCHAGTIYEDDARAIVVAYLKHGWLQQ